MKISITLADGKTYTSPIPLTASGGIELGTEKAATSALMGAFEHFEGEDIESITLKFDEND